MDRIHYNLTQFENWSQGYALLAGDDFSTTKKHPIAAKIGWTIYLQKISVMVTTDNAATQTFQDTAGTPIKAASTKVSPGIGPIVFDFGPDGFPLTEGEGLDHANSAAGLAGAVTITAYRKKTKAQAT